VEHKRRPKEKYHAGQTSPAAARVEALDALRGLPALLVMLFHIPIYHALKGAESFVNLQFCVDMFFALSGFAVAIARALEARPVVLLDLHGAHFRIPDREDGGLLYRPQNPSRAGGLA
jgi:hypothetical protein